MGENIRKSHIWYVYISIYVGFIKNPYNSTIKRQIQLKRKQAIWIHISSKKIHKQPISTWKDTQHKQSLGKCKIKTKSMKYQFLLIKGGLARWYTDKESTCQCRRCKRWGFEPWVGKIPWRRKWQPTPVFLPGKFHGQKNLVG